MKFWQLDECFKTNDTLSVRTGKNSVFFKDCFKTYHVCFDCFVYILHVSNLFKKEFIKQVLDSTCKIGREKSYFLKNYDFILFDCFILQILLYIIPKNFVLAVSLNY